MISTVPMESLDWVWSKIEPMVKRGLRHGQGDDTSSELVKEGLRRGLSSFWAVHEGEDIKAGIVLAVSNHPKGPKVFIELLAGHDMDSWGDELESILRDYKGLVGATCIEASCRRGLAKYLSRRGWKTKAIIMELI